MQMKDAMRKVIMTVPPDATLQAAAELMDQTAVGALVVLDGDDAVGIVTDRDLVVRGVARGLPSDARVDNVMTTALITLPADADLRAALPIFRRHAIRRLPLTENGKVMGMLTLDDLLIDVIADLADLARPITGEVVFGHPDPKVPAVAE